MIDPFTKLTPREEEVRIIALREAHLLLEMSITRKDALRKLERAIRHAEEPKPARRRA